MNRLPASTGWLWLKEGFALFRKQPGILMMLLFANLLATLLISVVPLIGPVVAMILVPSFTMAVMQACRLLSDNERVTPAVLLTGFRAPMMARLCRLGVVYMALSLALTVLTYFLIDEDFWRQVQAPIDPKTGPPKVSGSAMLSMMLVFALQSAAMLGLAFSAPLTYWKQMDTGKAVFYSVFGVLGAIRPLLLMLLCGVGMLLGVSIVTALILGATGAGRMVIIWVMLLALLLFQCAIYCAYRQIFGAPEAVSLDKPHAS